MKQRADWLAWSLHFIAGLIIGAILGLYITRRGWRLATTTPPQHLLMLVTGAAFIGAGLASYYGDRLWVGSSYRVILPDEISRNTTSKVLSIITGAIGGGLIFIALLCNSHIMSP